MRNDDVKVDMYIHTRDYTKQEKFLVLKQGICIYIHMMFARFNNIVR